MTTKETKPNKKVYNLIIVDESGSMSIIEHEALMGMNETLTTCRKMQEVHPEMEQHVTLITFDSTHFRLHYDNALASEIAPLNCNDYNPGGCTPLYDAIGMGIAKVNAQAGAGDSVLVTIITDGEENSSHEYNLTMVKNLVVKLKKQNWTFTLIGTNNLDVEGMAGSMAIDNHLEFAEDEASTKKMFARDKKCRSRYFSNLASDRLMSPGSYFDEDE